MIILEIDYGISKKENIFGEDVRRGHHAQATAVYDLEKMWFFEVTKDCIQVMSEIPK